MAAAAAAARPAGSRPGGYSLVQDCGEYNSHCGYCNSANGSAAHGMHAYRLTVHDYQELVDQGWRRSGNFLYKPDNLAACCQLYTIRLDVCDFAPSKAQKKLLRKWDNFLAGHQQEQQQQQQQQPNGTQSPGPHAGGTNAAAAAASGSHGSTRAQPAGPHAQGGGAGAGQPDRSSEQQQPEGARRLLQEVQALLLQAVAAALGSPDGGSGSGVSQQDLQRTVKVLPVPQPRQQQQQQQAQKKKHAALPAGTLCSSPCAHALAAAARKRQQQQQHSGAADAAGAWTSAEQLGVLLADTFNRLAGGGGGAGVTAVASSGHLNFVGSSQQQQQQGQQQQDDTAMQEAGAHRHSSSNGKSSRQARSSKQGDSQQQSPQAEGRPHQLRMVMVPTQFIHEEFELWRKYQARQHGDDPETLTPSQYKNFLVDSPLVAVAPPAAAAGAAAGAAAADDGDHPGAGPGGGGVPACGYGTFHQQYWLDGKLVAVGVVDVLPRCLSSKYFFWDPDQADLSPGRYGALREIAWVAAAHAAGASTLRYYYLGYYIHTCPKMVYKADYAPAELLCPQRQVWVARDAAVVAALDAAPYVVLSGLPGARVRPNLSVPRPLPLPPAGGGGGEAATAAAAGDAAGLPAPAQPDQPGEREALDGQLLFVMKQPVRWGVLRASGALAGEAAAQMDERLAAWRGVVRETARNLLYVAPRELL